MFKAKIYKYFYKKFRKSQIMPIVLFYRGNKLCLINLSRQGNAWNSKLKQKKLLRWLFTGQKRTLGKIKRMKKGIKLITLKKNKALRKYKKIQSAFQLYLTKKRNLKSVKFNKYLVGLIQHKQLLNNTKAHQRFLFLNKKFIIFFKKLFLLKKNYYMYQKVLSLKKKMVKKKLLKLGRYNNNRVPFNLARIRRSLVMSYRKRDFFKKTYLDFFMKLYQDKKAFANGKKKNYNKVLLRFFNRTCKPKATFYNYMKYYKYYRVKMLYYNFMQPHFKVKKQGRFFSNQYNKKAIRNKHKYASTRQAYFNFKLHYRLLLPKIFRSPNSKRYHQIKSRQMKYLKYRLYRNYFKRCYKRKVVNNSVFQLRRRIRKILPWRVKKFKYSYYQYQRFSYYWLRYFFHRFKKMYMNEETASYAYAPIKRYLLTWLFKLSRYKYLSLHAANPARGFLIYKSTQLYSKYKKKAYPVLKLKRFKPIRYFLNRQKIDWALRRDIFKKRYMYRSLYWRYYKDFFERKKISLLNRQYYFRRNYLPYVYTQKKHKMFYNWGDRHLFKRYPLYRYKYNLFFKFPRFADYRRLFKNQLREQHVFRYLYRLKLSQLIKHYRKSIYKTKRIFELMFLKHFELRLDTVIYRLNFAWTLKHARQLVLRGLFLVNNKIIDSHRYHISLGDVIMPIKRLRMQPLSKKYINTIDNGLWLSWNRLFFRSIQVDQYPEHFLLNERIPAGMLIGNVNPNKVRYNKPFSLQFLTLSLLKYN